MESIIISKHYSYLNTIYSLLTLLVTCCYEDNDNNLRIFNITSSPPPYRRKMFKVEEEMYEETL